MKKPRAEHVVLISVDGLQPAQYEALLHPVSRPFSLVCNRENRRPILEPLEDD